MRTILKDNGKMSSNRDMIAGIVDELNADEDDDWSYVLSDWNNGLYGINIIDEDGEIVQVNASLF